MEDIKMTEPKTFKITWGDEETVIEGRAEAVEFAKAKSADVPMNVSVESNDEDASSTISMTYHGGSLEVYVAETKSNDRRSRKRDRNEDEASTEESNSEDSMDDSSSDESSTEDSSES
jgi:hypothetical protein